MLRLRAVTGFAVDVSVSAGFLYVLDVGVTAFTHLMPSVVERMGGDFGDRRCPVVAVFPEALGYDAASNGPENQEGDHKNSGKAEEMTGVSEQSHAGLFPEAAGVEERPLSQTVIQIMNS